MRERGLGVGCGKATDGRTAPAAQSPAILFWVSILIGEMTWSRHCADYKVLAKPLERFFFRGVPFGSGGPGTTLLQGLAWPREPLPARPYLLIL